MELNELRKIAEGGEWNSPWTFADGFKGGGGRVIGVDRYPVPGCFNCGENYAVYEEVDARHIATFDPPTVLALLSRLEQAEQAVQRVREMATELRDTPASPESPKYARLLIEGAQAAGADMLHALDGDGRRLADDALGGETNG